MAAATTAQVTQKANSGIHNPKQQETDIGRDAFAAFEFEPHWKQVPQKGAERRRNSRFAAREMRGDGHGHSAFEHVAQKRRRGEPPAPGAQHVGGADIARTNTAHVRRTGKPA